MYKIVNEIADKYDLGDDVSAMIMKYIQRNLLKDGWTRMQSYTKNVEKIKKYCATRPHPALRLRDSLPDRYDNYCYETIHKLYCQNPTKGFHACIIGYGRLEREMKHDKSSSYKLDNMLSGQISYCKRIITISTGYNIAELRAYIEDNTDYCLTKKLKKSFKKSELLRIIIHEDPEGKIKRK
jgi:hypothetical protein